MSTSNNDEATPDPTGRREFPAGFAALAGRITIGRGIGWRPDRDGVPEAVSALDRTHGAGGLVATERLLREIDKPSAMVSGAEAERIVVWARQYYVGRYTAKGVNAEWDARGAAVKALYAENLRIQTAGLGDSIDWSEAVDWHDAALLVEQAGHYRFVVYQWRTAAVRDAETGTVVERADTHAEVDVFSLWNSRWDEGQDDA